MSQFRTILSVSLLWLMCTALASAVEVLPMDTVEPDCSSTSNSATETVAESRHEPAEAVLEAAEAPSGLQSVGGGSAAIRPNAPGGGDSSTPPAAKPSSRWNAFLPGMVR